MKNFLQNKLQSSKNFTSATILWVSALTAQAEPIKTSHAVQEKVQNCLKNISDYEDKIASINQYMMMEQDRYESELARDPELKKAFQEAAEKRMNAQIDQMYGEKFGIRKLMSLDEIMEIRDDLIKIGEDYFLVIDAENGIKVHLWEVPSDDFKTQHIQIFTDTVFQIEQATKNNYLKEYVYVNNNSDAIYERFKNNGYTFSFGFKRVIQPWFDYLHSEKIPFSSNLNECNFHPNSEMYNNKFELYWLTDMNDELYVREAYKVQHMNENEFAEYICDRFEKNKIFLNFKRELQKIEGVYYDKNFVFVDTDDENMYEQSKRLEIYHEKREEYNNKKEQEIEKVKIENIDKNLKDFELAFAKLLKKLEVEINAQ